MPLHRVVVLAGSAGSVRVILNQIRGIDYRDQSALFVVYHRPHGPGFKIESFAGRPSFEVRQAQDGEEVRSNVVYYPRDALDLEVRHGRLAVVEPEARHHPNLDRLLVSLASWAGPIVCAVVLSGMGDDGVAGALAIRAAGGQVLVQDPVDCQFAHLPRAVISAGAADRVLRLPQLHDEVDRLLGSREDEARLQRTRRPRRA